MRRKLTILEGIDESGTPDMKYYAFDWDDNIMFMPTKIILLNDKGDEVLMSTEDFAEHRTKIGVDEFEYNGNTIVSLAPDAFKFFRVTGDKNFIIDTMIAKPGPAWPDFVEAINGGSIFSIVTARGHTPSVMKESCYNLIISNHYGINSEELVKNLIKYRDIADEEMLDKKELIISYLDLCRFYPVTYGEGSAQNPEEGKIKALRDFVTYIKQVSSFIQKKAFIKNKISNRFKIPQIGFSDDDLRNLEKVKGHFKDEPGNIIKTISTAGGIKKPY